MAKQAKESKSEEAIVLLKESKDLIKAQQQEFRLKVQDLIKDNLALFQENLAALDPKDYCDTFIKMIPFGFGRAPEDKPKPADDGSGDFLVERTRVMKKLTDDY